MTKKTKPEKNLDLPTALQHVLADSYVLMIKTHGYHWNVTGEHFVGLHQLFGQQYNELFAAIDEIAERLRALDEVPLASMAAMLGHTCLTEAGEKPPKAPAMIADLIKSHEAVLEGVKLARELADDADDDASEDLMIGRQQVHEKALWMLRSLTK